MSKKKSSKPSAVDATSVSTKALIDAVALAADGCDAKAAHPAYGSVLVEVTGGVLTARSAGHMAIAAVHEGAAEGPDLALCAAPKVILERVKAMGSERVLVSVDSAHCVSLSAPGSSREFKFFGHAPADFPAAVALPDEGRKATMAARDFLALVGSVLYAASDDETRPHVNGVLLEPHDDGALRAVATDGHRLSTNVGRAEVDPGFRVIVTKRAMQVLSKMAAHGDTVTLRATDKQVTASVGRVTLVAPIPQAEFPPWKQVVPKPSPEHAVQVPVAAMVDTLTAIGVAASKTTGGVKLTFSGSEIEVASDSPDTGQARDVVTCAGDVPEVQVGLSPRYMVDALGAVSDGDATIQATAELDPILVTNGGDFCAVIMPMRI